MRAEGNQQPRASSALAAPLVPISLALLVGVVAAGWLSNPTRLEAGGVMAVGVLACAWRRGAIWVGASCLGCLLSWSEPALQVPSVAFERQVVVSAVVEIEGHWAPAGGFPGSQAWTAIANVRSLRWDANTRTHGPRVEAGGRLRIRLQGLSPPEARVLRLKGTLRSPSIFRNRDAGPMAGTRDRLFSLNVKSVRLAQSVRSPPQLDWSRLRAHLLARLDRAFGERFAYVFKAVVLGELTDIPDRVRRNLGIFGLGHLVALSGLHLSLLLALTGIFRRPNVRLWALLSCALGGSFLAVVGWRPSLFRALAMSLLGCTAIVSAKRPWAWNAWAAALLLVLSLRPSVHREVGFLLSFLAVAGILFWSRAQSRPEAGPLRSGLAQALLASASAQVATAWVVLTSFHVVSLGAVGLNVVFVPWTAVILLVGILGVVLGPRLPSSMGWVAWPFESVGRWDPAPLLNLHLSGDRLVVLWWSAVVLGGWRVFRRCRPTHNPQRASFAGTRCLALVALFGSVSGLNCVAPKSSEAALVHFYDVGQGDAFLVQSDKAHVLVDGGGWRSDGLGSRVLLPALLADGVRTLDLVVLSHADRDHCGGLVELAARLRVRELWLSRPAAHEPCGKELTDLVGKQGGRVVHPDRGRAFALPGGEIRLLGGGGTESAANDRSLLLDLTLYGRRFWLLGDATKAKEEALVARTGPLTVGIDVLKVAHHGSRSSTSQRLLSIARPKWALIGVGHGNSYGHPAQDVLARLTRFGSRVLRTDRHGQITFVISREGPLRVETVATSLRRSRPPER